MRYGMDNYQQLVGGYVIALSFLVSTAVIRFPLYGKIAPPLLRNRDTVSIRYNFVFRQGESELFGRCLQQRGIRDVLKSDTTFRSNVVRPKDTVVSASQDGVVY